MCPHMQSETHLLCLVTVTLIDLNQLSIYRDQNHYWSGWKLSSLSSKELTPPSYSCDWLEISTWTHHHVLIPTHSKSHFKKMDASVQCAYWAINSLSNVLIKSSLLLIVWDKGSVCGELKPLHTHTGIFTWFAWLDLFSGLCGWIQTAGLSQCRECKVQTCVLRSWTGESSSLN